MVRVAGEADRDSHARHGTTRLYLGMTKGKVVTYKAEEPDEDLAEALMDSGAANERKR